MKIKEKLDYINRQLDRLNKRLEKRTFKAEFENAVKEMK